jgi:hypothetical protein
MKSTSLLALTSIGMLFFSCGEDKTAPSPKKKCIETSINVRHLGDTLDVLETKHIVYGPNGKEEIIYTDTIPGLGMRLSQTDDGGYADKTEDYDLYITVK